MGSERIQQRFWHPVYHRMAWFYDAVDWLTAGTTHRLRRKALAHLPPAGARLLELGCGTGRLHLELAGRYELAGLDLAPGMAQRTSARLAAHGKRSRLCVGSALALPWPDAHFDAVLSTFVLSAIPDAERSLDEMVRVLRPGGRIVIVDAGEALDRNRMAHLLARLWESFGDYMRDEASLLNARGLSVDREDYGPWGCVHVVVGSLRQDVATADGSPVQHLS
jgi:ubiquinone/menaquinone biosynthesis C-methylase UbiE